MTQPDINVAVDYAIAQTGKPYHAYGARFGPNYFDCSGLVIASLRQAGVAVPSNVGNTVDLYRWGQQIGGLVSVQTAVQTRGAIMIKGRWWGYGPLGHTSFSLGNGMEMAAHGTRSGIHESPIYNGVNYNDGLIIPGVDYHLTPPITPADLEAIAKLIAWGKDVSAHPLHYGDPASGKITTLNLLLVRRALLDPKFAKMNIYGKDTADAVRHLKQLDHSKNIDGKVAGPEVVQWLLAPSH